MRPTVRSSEKTKLSLAERYFALQGWQAFAFQQEVWRAIAQGESGLLHATTGAGKTYAVWLGALAAWAVPSTKEIITRKKTDPQPKGKKRPKQAAPLTLLWITPMRALAADTMSALQAAVDKLWEAELLAQPWTVGLRTADTSSKRAAQDKNPPSALVTTPESLSLMLAGANAPTAFSALRMVVVDEWHELMGNKRGVQVQLALARLRHWHPKIVIWGLSATLGNVSEAMATLLGEALAKTSRLVAGQLPKTLLVDTLLPVAAGRFPWAGHLGLTMLPQVAHEIEHTKGAALVFLNTRSQAERWYQALLEIRPDWAGLIALHHSALDRTVRDWVERSLKTGALRAVICTSSLDLGVDFLPVSRVLQIGSSKGVARLLQRAGRSGHAPGQPSRVTLTPTHSLELLEAIATRRAIQAKRIEARHSPVKPLDVLVQHLVTVALGGGFKETVLLEEVRQAWAYHTLTDEEWQWCLNFIRQGGQALTAYPDYRRAHPDVEGRWHVPDARLARRHRMSIGTIVSDASMTVRYWKSGRSQGASLGVVEENFIARLHPGDCFLFAGKLLKLVRVYEMTAYVQRASSGKAVVPRWNGGKMSLSSELADSITAVLDDVDQGRLTTANTPELSCLQPLLDIQQRWSALPTGRILLAEVLQSREGVHLFLYPFAGRQAHLGLASLLAWRAAQRQPLTFSMAVNDYGFELLSASPVDWPTLLPELLGQASHALAEEVLCSLNAGELTQRRFREIARVAGLVFQGYPNAPKSARQLQASSSLFYEVFRKHDPQNLLLKQAEREVLSQELDINRLRAALASMASRQLKMILLKRPSPFAFPLMVERFREQLSTEKLVDRIARMLASLEKAADAAKN
jgi:ATP-dependent Lhr-like helicase